MKDVDTWLERFRAGWNDRFINLDILLRNLKTKKKNYEDNRKTANNI
jgi:hypothetical protein